MKQHIKAVRWTATRRMSMPFMIMGASIWVLTDLIDINLLTDLPTTIAALPFDMLVLTALFCALSLWAVARYDSLAHRHFATGVNETMARKSGFAAIAIAQTVGFGVLSGTAVRWRMLPDLGLKGALQLSTFVSVTFMAAFAFVMALVCLILQTPPWMTQPAALIVLVMPLMLLSLSFAPICAPIRHRVQIPSLRSCGALLSWTAFDVVAAAIALYMLIPSESLAFTTFLPIFLLALGAAMLSGAPGGVGPFELTLITLLPQVPMAELVAAIIAFRALYYAVPALLAVVVIFMMQKPRAAPSRTPSRQRTLPAELGILAQNGGSLVAHPTGSYALWHTTQTATLLFDPLTGTARDALETLCGEAKNSNRIPCVYKCDSQTALIARQQGWHVARIAQDCVLPLDRYDIDVPARRSLRRKMRQAQKAGVTVVRANALPLAEMTALDAEWQTAQGCARGGTMGRFCPDYLSQQDVYLAYHHGQLIAFASFLTDAQTHCLDLMRHGASVPGGTMHLIVQTAIDRARSIGKTNLSLAAVPDMPAWTSRTGPLRHKFTNPGLIQFKNSFAPNLVPKYAAAPTGTALALALADITTEVYWPRPLPHTEQPHNQDEDYEVAFDKTPWKGMLQTIKNGT